MPKDVEAKISVLRKMADVMKMPARQEVIHLERKCALHLRFLTMFNYVQAAVGEYEMRFSYMCSFMPPGGQNRCQKRQKIESFPDLFLSC